MEQVYQINNDKHSQLVTKFRKALKSFTTSSALNDLVWKLKCAYHNFRLNLGRFAYWSWFMAKYNGSSYAEIFLDFAQYFSVTKMSMFVFAQFKINVT